VTPLASSRFLGAPLNLTGVEESLIEFNSKLQALSPRLLRLPPHEAYFLLKTCFAIPKLQYLIRTAPVFSSQGQVALSGHIRETLSAILNVRLDEDAWTQASLPVRWGDVGVRDICSLAPSAFLSSLTSTSNLVKPLLPASLSTKPDPLLELALTEWASLGGISQPTGAEAAGQRAWDEPVCVAIHSRLLLQADSLSRARLLAASAPDAGAWLNTLPIRSLGLILSGREIRIAVGLRLGAPLVRSHTCVCGVEVDSLGHHGLSCRRSSGRHRRHAQANDIIARALRAADVQVQLEPPRLLRDNGKRPDGATLDPWSRGRYLVWDFTCPDTLAPSYVAHSSTSAGSAAARAEQLKNTKYSQLRGRVDILFAPMAIESLGTWGPSAADICKEIGSRLALISGDTRSLSFLRQRLGLAVQRGNAAAISGTSPSVDFSL